MTDNVHRLHPHLVGDAYKVPPEDVLEAAKEGARAVVVVTETEDGEILVASSEGAGDALMLLAWAQAFLVENRVQRG